MSDGITARRATPTGRCYLYVFPCTWEDHCKIGFSRDPLSRIQALHHRYFEFFDLDQGWLVEAETERDARDLELALHHQLVAHRAPAPLVVRQQAAGHTEWYRGAEVELAAAMQTLQARGHTVHAPLRPWIGRARSAQAELLHAWTLAQLSPVELAMDDPAHPGASTQAQQLVRDALDGCRALAIDLESILPADVAAWYFKGSWMSSDRKHGDPSP